MWSVIEFVYKVIVIVDAFQIEDTATLREPGSARVLGVVRSLTRVRLKMVLCSLVELRVMVLR